MKSKLFLLFVLAVCFAFAARAEFRFPMPEFESGYQHPQTNAPTPSLSPAAVDIAVLTAALSVAAWAVIWKRSRRIVLLLTLFSVGYFGFYRHGCVCSVGSMQNVIAALLDRGAGLPIVVIAFFFLPILFAFYFGRVFCAAVCPLGGVQEIAAVFPVRLPRPLEAVLGLLPYAYLGVTILSMIMGAGFMICRYDPFVGFFRRGASFNMLIFGGLLLLLGVFVARPYCRFLCPYGVLLRWASRLARWRATVTPSECIKCRLCETSCPYGAILIPEPEAQVENRRVGVKRLAKLLLLAPVIIVVSAIAGGAAHGYVARMHPTVRLAERVFAEEQGRFAERSVESDAYRAGNRSVEDLYAAANDLKRRYKYGSAWLGGFMGLVVCAKLIRLSVVRRSEDYVPDAGACVSCARCFAYCPVEKE
jgi:ferredoxin